MEIRFADMLEYLNRFSHLSTRLSDFYFRMKDCAYVGAYEDDVPVGFLQYEKAGNCFEVLTICTENAESREAMLRALCVAAAKENGLVRWRIVSQNLIGNAECRTEDAELAEKIGFRRGNTVHLFGVRPAVMDWEAFTRLTDTLRKMSDRMKRAGFSLCPFFELTKEQLAYICDNPEHEFASFLRSGDYISGKGGTFDDKISAVALKNGKPVAYTVIRAPGGHGCIVENISVAEAYRKTGVLAVVLSYTLDMLGESDYHSMTFAVYENNVASYSIMRKWVTPILTSEKIQYNYEYGKNPLR